MADTLIFVACIFHGRLRRGNEFIQLVFKGEELEDVLAMGNNQIVDVPCDLCATQGRLFNEEA